MGFNSAFQGLTSIIKKATRDDATQECHADSFFVCCILPLRQVLSPTEKGLVMVTKVTGYGILCVPHKLMKSSTVKEGGFRSRNSVFGIVKLASKYRRRDKPFPFSKTPGWLWFPRSILINWHRGPFP
jgi:hypothetical protein